MTLRGIWEAVDWAMNLLYIDYVRIISAVLISILICIPFKRIKDYLSPIIAVLVFHGLAYATRWYHCPLDPPLSLVETMALANDYVYFWVGIAIAFVAIVGFGLWLLWRIWRELEKIFSVVMGALDV